MDRLMVPRVERRARRMHELLDRVGADRAALARIRGGDAYMEARRRCLLCGTSDKCLRWLDQPRSQRRPEFCPNLTLFEASKRAPRAVVSATKPRD